MTVASLLDRLKVAGAVTGAAVLAAGLAFALPAAGERMDRQAEKAEWSALAHKALQAETHEVWDGESITLQSAALSLEADPEASLLLPTRTIADLTTFGADHLMTAQEAARQQRCLAQAIYYEARSEPLTGQLAVAEVVMNRVRHRAYPGTICDVVFQGRERVTGCQFTFTCDGSLAIAPYGRHWNRAQSISAHVTMGFAQPVTRRATHYHTTQVDPYWNDNLVRTRNIGMHIFYRFPNRRERSILRETQA